MIAAFIPARFNATRFPGKLMQKIGEHSVIATTYLNTVKTKIFNQVYVVTDSQIIAEEIKSYNGEVIMSKKNHESGTDRIAEAIEHKDVDIVVNIQGDEPFVNKEALNKLLSPFKINPETQVSTIVQPLTNQQSIADPNYVKVALDLNKNALFFSRSPIPYPRDQAIFINYFEHIGLYAFTKNALLKFYHHPATPLEQAEKIECLRFLEMGIPIAVEISNYMGIEIDTPEDLIVAQQYLHELIKTNH